MPDTDVLADAFAAFTDQAAAEITTPGVAAVRRTIRRRRTRHTAITAFVLIAALLGAGTAWRGLRSPGVAPAGPTVTKARYLEQLRKEAVAALPAVHNVLTSDSTAVLGNYTNPSRDLHTPNGPISVYFSCFGVGDVVVKVAIDGETTTISVGCTNAPGASSWHVQPFNGPGYLFVHLQPNDMCIGRCAFAYQVADGPDQTGYVKK